MKKDNENKQIYAIHCSGGWAILEAHIPCEAGQGRIIESGVPDNEIEKRLEELKEALE